MWVKRLLVGAYAVGVLLIPSLALCQSWDEPWSDPRDRPARVDVSITAGMIAPTDWSDLVLLGRLSPVSGVLEQVLVRDVRVEPAPSYGASVTYWRDRYGFRVNAELSRSSLKIGGAPEDGGRDVTSVDMDTWLYGVRGVIGLLDYSPSRNAWPYVFLGAGAITYDLSRTVSPPLLTFVGQGRPTGSGDIVIVDERGGRQFLLAIDELGLETVFAFDFGAGTDLRLPFGGGGIGLRLEVSDHISPSPLGLRIRELSSIGGLTQDDAVRFGTVNHLRAVAGLVIQFGR